MLLPIVSGGTIRSVINGTDEVSEIAEQTAKHGDELVEGAESTGKAAQILGVVREKKVADLTGGRVSREPIKSKGGGTDIDVAGPNGELIMVGGPAKAKNLSALGDVIKIYKDEASIRGVKVMAYFSKETPQSVVDFAVKRLGKENVFVFD